MNCSVCGKRLIGNPSDGICSDNCRRVEVTRIHKRLGDIGEKSAYRIERKVLHGMLEILKGETTVCRG